MINFLGTMPDREHLLRIDGLAFHDYGKEARPGRKLGHLHHARGGARAVTAHAGAGGLALEVIAYPRLG